MANMSKYRYWTDEEIDNIVSLYISGKTKKQIAKIYDTTVSSIEHCMNRARKPKRKKQGGKSYGNMHK